MDGQSNRARRRGTGTNARARKLRLGHCAVVTRSLSRSLARRILLERRYVMEVDGCSDPSERRPDCQVSRSSPPLRRQPNAGDRPLGPWGAERIGLRRIVWERTDTHYPQRMTPCGYRVFLIFLVRYSLAGSAANGRLVRRCRGVVSLPVNIGKC